MPRAVIYLRVSTDEQASSGLGLEAQAAACRAAADRLSLEAGEAELADQGVSGAAPLERRLGLMEAVGLLRGGDVLLVAKRDRLGRDPIAVATIEAAVRKRGARVVSAAGEGTDDDDPASILMRRLVDAFAEYERLLIKARTRAALAAKARRGERTGQIPYGRRMAPDGRTLEADPAGVRALLLIDQLARRRWSHRAIAAELDRMGLPTKQGGRWARSTVARLIRRMKRDVIDEDDDQAEGEGGGHGPRDRGAAPRGDRAPWAVERRAGPARRGGPEDDRSVPGRGA